MLKFNNNHIFTGYLKQLLSSVNLPSCKIYTTDFVNYYQKHGKEDPRVVESFNSAVYETTRGAKLERVATKTVYLKNNRTYIYDWKAPKHSLDLRHKMVDWKNTTNSFYEKDKFIPGLTKTLYSPGNVYDTNTHEYLGEYLRFLRDYYNINLMSLYNCFSNQVYNNIYYAHKIKSKDKSANATIHSRIFDSRDSSYNIYAFPVKLFSNYTIAIDCAQGVEMFCGLYKSSLYDSDKNKNIMARTYKKVNQPLFNQPFLYDKLDVKNWNFDTETKVDENGLIPLMDPKIASRCDIISKEQDLKLFIKVPISCKSSIVVLEGDYRNYNDFIYKPKPNPKVSKLVRGGTKIKQLEEERNLEKLPELAKSWNYSQNKNIINFNKKDYSDTNLNETTFKPISKLQLLAFNTGTSYPFSDRLIEYLSGSAITPIDEISDNIKRIQNVMEFNNYYFRINGLWEDKMQKIIYDYLMNHGPIIFDKTTESLDDLLQGKNPKIGFNNMSTIYDILGYCDRDAEKWYASWSIDKENKKAKIKDNIQNTNIYGTLYDFTN